MNTRKDEIYAEIMSDKSVKSKTHTTDYTEMIINFSNQDNLDKVVDIKTRKLTIVFEIVKEQVIKPTMKIVEINNFERMDVKKLQDYMNERNFGNLKEGCILDTRS